MSTNSTPATPAYIDINNIKLSDEIIDGFDPTANQFAAPQPVKPGLYTVTLFYQEEDASRRWFPLAYNAEKYPTKAGKTYAKTRLVGRINQPGGEFDGRRVRDTFVSTGIFEGQTTSKVASLVHLFGRGGELFAGMTDTQLRDLFDQCIAGEPQVKVVTDWEWQGSKEGGYQTVRGQKNFPTDPETGKPIHIITDTATGNAIPGFAAIISYRGGN